MDTSKLKDTDSITTKEFADFIQLSVNTVNKMARDGKLKMFTPANRNRRVLVSEAKRYCLDHGIAWEKPGSDSGK